MDLHAGLLGRPSALPLRSQLLNLKTVPLTRQVVYAAERCAYAILEIDAAAAAARPTLTAAAEQADRLTPILCACAPGADPLVEVSLVAVFASNPSVAS